MGKIVESIYLEDEDKFEPIKKIRKVWVRRPTTKVKDREGHKGKWKNEIN